MKLDSVYRLIANVEDLILPPKLTCCGQMIGHGSYRRYCQDLGQTIKVKRSLCKKCLKTKSLLPVQLVRFFQSSAELIRTTLHHRLKFRCWPERFPRQRGGHWLCRLWQVLRGEAGQVLPIDYLEMCHRESVWLFK
jgi:hypothetical protein